MGRGNWTPCQEEEDVRYFDLSKRYPDEEPEYLYNRFLDDIADALPESFWKVHGHDSLMDFDQVNNHLIFRNQLVAIVVDPEGDDWHFGLAWVPTGLHPGLSEAYLWREVNKFWKKLGGVQRVRTSAWTSKVVIP